MDIIKIENIADLIFKIRNKKVIIDSDVANIYGVETKRINEAVKKQSWKVPKRLYYSNWSGWVESVEVEFFDFNQRWKS